MIKAAKIAVTDNNLAKAALRLLGQRLVSPETQYIRSQLAAKVTQQELDDSVLAVRKLPWASIAKFD